MMTARPAKGAVDPLITATVEALRVAAAALERAANPPAAPGAPGPRWLKAAEVADRLGLSSRQIYNLMAEGVLPSIRVGRSVRCPEDALERWMQARTVGAREGGALRWA